jgi:hypothetical protein
VAAASAAPAPTTATAAIHPTAALDSPGSEEPAWMGWLLRTPVVSMAEVTVLLTSSGSSASTSGVLCFMTTPSRDRVG